MKRYLDASSHALIGASFLTLVLTGRLHFFAIVVFMILFLGSVYRTMTGERPLLTPRTAFYLCCGYLSFLGLDAWLLSRSMISATIHMVLFLELVKLHQEKTDKDYFYIILLSFSKVLAASSLTVELSFVLALLLFLTAFVSTLIAFEMYRAERRSLHEAGTAAAGRIAMTSVWSTAWIVVLGAGLFLTIPRIGTGYFTNAAITPLLLSGFNENVALGQIGQVKLGSAVVMHVKRLAGTPHSLLKWRGIALDTFDGRRWYKKDRSRAPVLRAGDGYTIDDSPMTGEAVRYEILLEPIATTTLFGPFQVRSIFGRGVPSIDTDAAGAIYTRFGQSRPLQYQVVSEIPKRLRPDAPEPANLMLPAVDPGYLQLPQDLDPRVVGLAQTITSSGSTAREKAFLVEAYLKRNYRYTLTLDWNPGRQPVTTFLLSSKSGHCEYFASAMTILLRAAGIPARLVNGFMMGEYNPVGDGYVVRQSDAHSWVEVYLPGSGWIEFDPTPPDGSEPDRGLVSQIGNYVDAVGLYWNTYILTFDMDSQRQMFRSAQERLQHLQDSLQDRSDRISDWTEQAVSFVSGLLTRSLPEGTGWISVLSAAGAVCSAAFFFRRELRIRWTLHRLARGRHRFDRGAVDLLFHRAVQLAEAGGGPRLAGQTWREWAGSLADRRYSSAMAPAIGVFERSVYGRRGSTAAKEADAADIAVLEQTIRTLRSLLQ